MYISSITSCLIIYIIALLGIAFFTLLERKILGYIQLRKGPNKVSIIGIPQPFADAIKLFLKEQSKPKIANIIPFIIAPSISLFLSLTLWSLSPHFHPSYFIPIRVAIFLCISRLNVYSTLGAGWFSNSKYALLGSLRRVAQTISYEVSISLILLRSLILIKNLSILNIFFSQTYSPFIIFPILLFCWFTSCLAETNRTPFDFAEGESELVSGFNTEYRRGTFALLFIAEYANIIIISLFTSIFFFNHHYSPLPPNFILIIQTTIIASLFLWIRGTLPRIRYDLLINLTWKSFLPFSLALLTLFIPLSLAPSTLPI